MSGKKTKCIQNSSSFKRKMCIRIPRVHCEFENGFQIKIILIPRCLVSRNGRAIQKSFKKESQSDLFLWMGELFSRMIAISQEFPVETLKDFRNHRIQITFGKVYFILNPFFGTLTPFILLLFKVSLRCSGWLSF